MKLSKLEAEIEVFAIDLIEYSAETWPNDISLLVLLLVLLLLHYHARS